jgi:hypothetical protein
MEDGRPLINQMGRAATALPLDLPRDSQERRPAARIEAKKGLGSAIHRKQARDHAAYPSAPQITTRVGTLQRYNTLCRLEGIPRDVADLSLALRPLGSFEHLFWPIDQSHPVHLL